jgi:hypothetical protein
MFCRGGGLSYCNGQLVQVVNSLSNASRARLNLNSSTAALITASTASSPITPTLMANITLEDVSQATDIFQDVEQAPSVSPSLTNSTVSASTLLDTALSVEEDATVTQKKKKKKKPKKSSKAKAEANSKPSIEDDEPSPLVLRISRNKHWRYISSYHVCLPFYHPIPTFIVRETGPLASAPDRAPRISSRPQSRPCDIPCRAMHDTHASSPATTTLFFAHARSWLRRPRGQFPARFPAPGISVYILSSPACAATWQTDPPADRPGGLPLCRNHPSSHR